MAKSKVSKTGKIRLDKYLSSQTKLSRTDAVKSVYHHKVSVNGRTATDPAMKVDVEADEIMLNGEKLIFEEYVYYILNKPAGVISATEDKEHKTVCDLVPGDIPVAPVGRLDIDTEGLILLTNDGKLAHELISPKKHVDKKYYAKIDGPVTEEMIKAFEDGFDYGDEKPSLPGKLIVLGPEEFKKNSVLYSCDIPASDDNCDTLVTIHEGKFHQVKRMFKAFDREVLYLKRISFGELTLPQDLPVGEYLKIKRSDITRS